MNIDNHYILSKYTVYCTNIALHIKKPNNISSSYSRYKFVVSTKDIQVVKFVILFDLLLLTGKQLQSRELFMCMLYFSQSFDCLVNSKTKIKVNTNYFIYELVHSLTLLI